jgi:hypothetical protein
MPGLEDNLFRANILFCVLHKSCTLRSKNIGDLFCFENKIIYRLTHSNTIHLNRNISMQQVMEKTVDMRAFLAVLPLPARAQIALHNFQLSKRIAQFH